MADSLVLHFAGNPTRVLLVDRLREEKSGETLYLARQTQLRQDMQLWLSTKLTDSQLSTKALEKLRAQMEGLARAKAPGLATILGHGVSQDGRIWIAYEPGPGKPLPATKLPAETVATLGAKLAVSLNILHQAGKYHGSIRRDNLAMANDALLLLGWRWDTKERSLEAMQIADVQSLGEVLTSLSDQPLPIRGCTTALALADALEGWQDTQIQRPKDNQFLEKLERMLRRQENLPSLSRTLGSIKKSAETGSVDALADAILMDPGLATRLLRAVNSAAYRQFGGAVGTVSRAIVILGFDAVKSLASTLAILDSLEKKADGEGSLREIMAETVYASLLAMELGMKTHGCKHVEEIRVAALLQGMGEMMVAFHFPEDYRRVLVAAKGVPGGRNQAAFSQLGVDLQTIGQHVLSLWNMDQLAFTSNTGQGQSQGKGLTPYDRDSVLKLALAGHLLAHAAMESRQPQEAALVADMLFKGTPEAAKLVTEAVASAASRFDKEAKALSFVYTGAGQAAHKEAQTWKGREPAGADPVDTEAYGETGDPDDVIAAGLHELALAAAEGLPVWNRYDMALEVLFRTGLFDNVVLFTKEDDGYAMRQGMGQRVRDKEGRHLYKRAGGDLLGLCIDRHADVLISDGQTEAIEARMPEGYIPVASFLLLPVKQGVFYLDSCRKLNLTQKTLALMKALRAQAMT